MPTLSRGRVAILAQGLSKNSQSTMPASRAEVPGGRLAPNTLCQSLHAHLVFPAGCVSGDGPGFHEAILVGDNFQTACSGDLARVSCDGGSIMLVTHTPPKPDRIIANIGRAPEHGANTPSRCTAAEYRYVNDGYLSHINKDNSTSRLAPTS
jgi:hypothetical protein